LQALAQSISAGKLEYRVSIILLLLCGGVDHSNIADFGGEIVEPKDMFVLVTEMQQIDLLKRMAW
jgi:hypothetical protein